MSSINEKISDVLFENKYVQYTEFSCRDKFDIAGGGMVGNSHYKFNFAEKIGNALIAPLSHAGKRATHIIYPSRKWFYLGLLASIPAALGIILKKIGESANPNSARRYKAIEQIEELKSNRFSYVLKGLDNVNDTYKLQRELKEKVKEHNYDNEKIKKMNEIFKNYVHALKTNKNTTEHEESIDTNFPEINQNLKDLASLQIEMVKRLEDPFGETEPMKKYRGILAEMDKVTKK